jgi:hypothetical protein
LLCVAIEKLFVQVAAMPPVQVMGVPVLGVPVVKKVDVEDQ